MRFVCDSCRAQYMISDEKVGASGVKVRCKKCGHVIIVRRPDAAAAEADAALRGLGDEPMGAPAPQPPEAPTGANDIFNGVDEDEIGAAFDTALGERQDPPPAPEGNDQTQVMDGDAVARLAAMAEGNVPPATDAAPPAADWFVAIDEKQTGPLSPESIRELWDRGEIGPDSLTWRQGLEDWVPLSDVAELAAWLAPRPARPVLSSPSGAFAPVAPVVSVPVESAFSAGGVTRTVRTEVPTPVPDAGGWKPSASAALASLVKEEIQALSKPDVPPPAPAPVAGPARGLLEVPPPTGEVPINGRGARPEAPTPVTERPAYAPAPAYPFGSTRPKAASNRPLVIGGAIAGVVVVGLVAAIAVLFFRTRTQPDPVAARTPAETPRSASSTSSAASTGAATSPATSAAAPGAAAASATPPPPSTTTPPPTATPAVTTPPVAHVTPAVAPGEATGTRRGGKGSRTRGGGSAPAGPTQEVASAEPARPAGKGNKTDDLFDEVFGTGGGEKPSGESGGGRGKKTAYVPPAPGAASTSDAPERLPKGDIMSVVLANKPSIVRCVSEQKARDPNLHGTLVMHWVIQTSGKTTGVQGMTDPFKSSYMATCLTGLVRSWNFPKHRYQPGEPVDFPFTF